MPPSRLTFIFPTVTFAILGAFLSGILLVQHSQAERGDCGSSGCSEILTSRWATFPPTPENGVEATGVPVALLGMAYFLGLGLWMLVVGRLSWSQRLWHSLPMAVALLGGVVSIALISGMAFLEAWCPLCLAVHAINLALVPYIILSAPERGPDDADDSTATLRPVLTGLALAVCAGLAVGFGWDSLQYRERNQELSDALARASAGALAQPGASEAEPTTFAASNTVPPAASPASSAPVLDFQSSDADTVVVFTDLLCPHCRVFEQRLFDEIVPKFGDRLRVSIKHFPLCAQCNQGLTDLHPWACEAAYLAEAGRQQGGSAGFLKVLRAISPRRTQPWSDEDAIAIAVDAGLNPQKFVADWHSDAVHQRVAADVARGKQLGVNETPTVFVNGVKLDSQVRDLPEYWEQLALRARQPRRTSPAATNGTAEGTTPSTGTHQVAKPATDTEALPPPPAAPEGNAFTPAVKSAFDSAPASVLAKEIVKRYDANNDGILDKVEYSRIKGDFAKYDTNNDNLLSVEELTVAISVAQRLKPVLSNPSPPVSPAPAP